MNNFDAILVNADAGRIPLEGGKAHCCVTSPPYFSLRRYEGEQGRAWPAVTYVPMLGLPGLTVEAMTCPLGLEPTPEAYVAHVVLCCREIKRVLRDDGVFWMIVGDSFAGGGGPESAQTRWQVEGTSKTQCGGQRRTSPDAGQLLGVPYRLMLALQGDGWIVRQDCVWARVV